MPKVERRATCPEGMGKSGAVEAGACQMAAILRIGSAAPAAHAQEAQPVLPV
jgi:hypothetical protein